MTNDERPRSAKRNWPTNVGNEAQRSGKYPRNDEGRSSRQHNPEPIMPILRISDFLGYLGTWVWSVIYHPLAVGCVGWSGEDYIGSVGRCEGNSALSA
jgi:hypothetical protein